jgi:hypothetical protein
LKVYWVRSVRFHDSGAPAQCGGKRKR